MLRALLNRLVGKSSSRKTGVRPKPARRTVLTLESLEKRELLSANVPGFSLSNGNLYNTAISSTQPIDNGVLTFAVSGATVYDLHTGGMSCMNTDGSAKTSLPSPGNAAAAATTYAMDTAGDLFTLDGNHNLAVNGVGSSQAQALYQGYDQTGAPVVYAYQGGVLSQYNAGSWAYCGTTASVVQGCGQVLSTSGSGSNMWVVAQTGVAGGYASFDVVATGANISLFQGHDQSGNPVAYMYQGSVLSQYTGVSFADYTTFGPGYRQTTDNCWAYAGTTATVVQGCGQVLSTSGSGSNMWVIAETGVAGGYASFDEVATGANINLYQGHDPNGNPVAYILQNGVLEEYTGVSFADYSTFGAGYHQTTDTCWTFVASDIQSLQAAPDGSVYYLEANGNLYGRGGWASGLGWRADQRSDRRLPGRARWQPVLAYHPRRWRHALWIWHLRSCRRRRTQSPGRRINVVSGGPGQFGLLWLDSAGDLYGAGGWAAGRPNGLISDQTAAFQLAPDGSLYWLTTPADGGTLYGYGDYVGASGGALSRSAGGVVSFQVADDGSVYWLDSAGDLYRRAPGSTTPYYLSPGVASFGVGGDGYTYFLTNAANPTGAGNLFQNTPTSNNLVSAGVASFGVGGDGRVYFLTDADNPTGAGNLYIAGLPAGQNLVSAGVASFGVGGDGRVYFLTDASCPAGPGNLYIAGLPAGQNLVGSDVASFAIRGDGNLYLLHTNFDLTLNSPNGNQLQDFGAVQGFALGSDGNAYYLLPNGDLCHDAHPSEVLHDIRAFAVGADGSLDVLTRGGYLSRNGVLVGHTHLVIFPLYSVNAFVAAIVLDPAIEATPIQYKEAGAFTGLGTAYEPSAFPATTATTPASYWASPQGMAESMQSVLQGVLNWASQSASLIVGLSVGVVSGEFGNSIQAAANALVDSVLSDQAIKGIVANVVPANEAEQAEEGVALVVAAATLSTGNLASTFVSLLFSPTVIDGLGDVVLDISLPIYNQVYNTSLSYQPVGGAGGSGGSGGSVSGSGNGGAGGGAGLWGGVSSAQSDSGDGSNSLTGSF